LKYDAIVIGSGQHGNPLAYSFAEMGWQVALIEKDNFGGTCVNTGCTPTKTMVHRAQILHYAQNAARWGVRAENVAADLPTIVAQKDKVVTSFRGGLQKKENFAGSVGNLPYTALKGAVYVHATLCEGFFTLLDSVKPVD
jgi:pyruvate/2-oxoglutarate dehydrogenase complex dihydrolipoamide dehydrogenase (E3) component